MRARLALALLSALLVSASPLAGAEPGGIRGRVLDEAGEPAYGATVTVTDVSGRTQSASAGAAGNYAFAGLEPGPYRVTATLPGFGRQSDHLLVEPGVTIDAVFTLRLIALEELVASATRKARTAREAPATTYVVTESMIRERGYNYLYDALRDAPGLDVIWMGGLYGPILMPRGLDSQESNKLILMVDGVVDNNLSAGTAQVYMQYSLHNVKRIEVIYGPASALHGANAMGGLVNIVTRTGEDLKGLRVQVGGMSWDPAGRRTGVLANAALGRVWGGEGEKVDLALSAHVVDTDGTDLRIDSDEARSDRPGDPAKADYYFSPDHIGSAEAGTYMVQGRLHAQKLGLTVGGHAWQHDGGQGTYGHEGAVMLNGLLNQPSWNFRNVTAFATHRKTLRPGLTNTASVVFRDTRITDGYDLYFDVAGTGPDGAGSPPASGSRYFRPDHSWKFEDGLQWEPTDRTFLTVGLAAELQYVSDYQTSPTGATFDHQMLRREGLEPVVDEGRRYRYRDYSAYLEHAFKATDRLTLTTGLRFDVFELAGDETPAFVGTNDADAAGNCPGDRPSCLTPAAASALGAREVSRVYYRFGPYQETRTTVNPRVGVVFAAVPDRLTVKALYGEGFRMPTVRELFSVSGSRFANPDLDAEKIRTAEASATLQFRDRDYAEMSLFHTTGSDFVVLTPGDVLRPRRSTYLNQFQNVGEPRVSGLEIKAQVQASKNVEVFGHYSFQDARYEAIDAGNLSHVPGTSSLTDTDDRIPRQAAHKGLLGASLHLWKRRVTVTPRVNLVGARPAVITSPLQEVDAYGSLNVSMLVRDVVLKGLNLSAVGYNLTNADILDPGFRTANKVNDFPAVHPQPGLNLLVKLTYNRSF